MGLITKEVQVRVNSYTIKYYEDKGYVIPKKENGKYDLNAYFTVKVEDLSSHSTALVDYSCDYCGKLLNGKYYTYYNQTQGIVPKNCCKDCMPIKLQESNLITYGTKSVLSLDSVKEKVTATVRERYGVDHPSQSEEVKQRMQNTFMERYGTPTPSQNPDVIEKIKQTNNLRYGGNSPMQNEDIKKKNLETVRSRYGCDNVSQIDSVKQKKNDTNMEKYGMWYSQTQECKDRISNTSLQKYGTENYLSSQIAKEQIKQTNLSRYGYENPFSAPEIKQKIRETYYKNGTVCTSRQQEYLNNLYKTKINYPILSWNVDMFDDMSNLIIEYNGGGHMLSVKLGEMTQEEFEQKEIVRNNMIKRAGYKMMTIISTTDKLPFDDILLGMLDDAKKYFFDYSNHSWITFNIDEGTVESAEFKRSYFYGELRKIKKSA